MKSYFKHSLWHFLGFWVFAAVFSAIVMLLWNWWMPTIFGLSCIGLGRHSVCWSFRAFCSELFQAVGWQEKRWADITDIPCMRNGPG